MQGQFKVPGGKLVIADFQLMDQRLHDVRIHGDFFLEPDSALDLINVTLEGLPSDSDLHVIASTVDACLPPNTVMYGFDSTAIATAILRGLSRETTT